MGQIASWWSPVWAWWLYSAMRITRAWRVAPAWVRELIDEVDGVRKVGCYWVNRVSGMGIRSPFIFDHVSRILRFKGFSDPIHESKIFNNSPPDPDWDLVRFNESGVNRLRLLLCY